ncbi:hypothetical protein VIGAN_05257800 [Vigna angularis var. angularis]|uniref:DUF6469 domain-containing protein n=1 Tax=Vigna angularis var. angularis TaxID=157739 RepID=A0A0S3S7Z6_PHAAN|nr:hypothetical protein VIGAN_05257800 [Vigna angularis var. angularis]
MMQGDPSSKKKDNDDYGFTNLIFSWSIENILDEDLYRNKVEKIAQTFQSTDHYFGSYTYPLLEETRAQLCSSMEIIHQAPYAEVIGLKEAKSDHNNLYKLAINCWKNRFTHSGEPYKTFPGDFLILSDYRPEAIKDLQRNGRMWSFVSVRTTEDGNDDDFKLKVEASKELDPTNWRNKPLFLIFLTNMIPNKRIWAALHMPGNFEILKQILCTKEDAPNVGRYDFGKKYLPGPMFGPYSFINVVGGKEQFDDEGSSYKNLAEVAVVMTILKNLHKGCVAVQLLFLFTSAKEMEGDI